MLLGSMGGDCGNGMGWHYRIRALNAGFIILYGVRARAATRRRGPESILML